MVATFDDHYDSVRSVAWPDDSRLLTTSIDREIKLWDLEKKAKALLTYKGHSRSVNAVCLLKDGKTLVSAGVDQVAAYLGLGVSETPPQPEPTH